MSNGALILALPKFHTRHVMAQDGFEQPDSTAGRLVEQIRTPTSPGQHARRIFGRLIFETLFANERPTDLRLPTKPSLGRMAAQMSNPEIRALLLFDRYFDMPEGERRRRLAKLLREDAPLHDELAALLRADAEANPRLDRAPLEALAPALSTRNPIITPDKHIGQVVGNWRIVNTIAHGGMGIVYQVERIDGHYRQSAALKYVRADISSPRLVSAFLKERDVLAQFSHPDIVPLLDGGVDAEGHPWFVMQQVDGQPITSWCDRHGLTLRRRVELFIDACNAVAYAHARGTLHQDLKPSNILVTSDGRPRLLDFGLSDTLFDVSSEGHKHFAMTAGYTPPERLKGQNSGFASDIYALGVVLYQLLCGRFPVKPTTLRHEPAPPSRLAETIDNDEATARGVKGPRELTRKLKGELDAIALRCVATDPDARYADVETLQTDLRAWLAVRPVAAYAQGSRYHFGCFVRRHQPIFILGGIVVLLAAATAMLWNWQARRAEFEVALTQRVNQLLENTLGMATLSGLGDMPIQAGELLDHAESTLREEAPKGQPGSREVLARGLSILARSRALTGDYRHAEALASEALNYSDGDPLQTAFNQSTLARIYNLQARHAEAEHAVQQGLDQLSFRLTDQQRLAWVRLQDQLAAALSGQGQSRRALETLEQAMIEARKLPPSIGNPVLAQLLIQRGTWYRWRMHLKESETDLLHAIDLAGSLDPVTADDARESLLRTVRSSRKPGREARALEMAKQLLDSRQHTLGNRHVQTGTAWTELAFVQMLNSDYDSAKVSLQRAEELVEKPLGDGHPATARIFVAHAFYALHDGKIEEAMMWAEKARAIYATQNGPANELTLEARFLLASLYWSRSSMTGDKAAIEKAAQIEEAALGDAERAHGTVAVHHRIAYADLLRSQGKRDEARRQLAIARADALWQFGANSQEMLGLQLSESALMIDDDAETTEAALDHLIADAAKIDTLYATAILHTAWLKKGEWFENHHKLDQARTFYQHARETAERVGQKGWMAVAEHRLAALEQTTTTNPRSNSSR